MSIAPGTRLGPYEITAKLGEGGMGEVYRATDTKLEREVAIKVLPAAFVEDPERLARFEREAQAPGPAQPPQHRLDLRPGGERRRRALVMELVEGPTLAERLEHGPIPLDEALLDRPPDRRGPRGRAREGDHPPRSQAANIKAHGSKGKVKVLDFGLAKAMDPTGAASGGRRAIRSCAARRR